MGIPLLQLRFEGPLQSWGGRSKFYFRDTTREPTKSGLIGLIGCALGYPRYDTRLEKFDSQLRMGVRVDREGVIINEFQTIDSGYITADRSFQSKGIIRTKQYLQDASFLVLLTGEPSVLDTIEEALINPRWPYYLGRKCCVPSMPILMDMDRSVKSEYASLEEALSKIPYSCPYTIPIKRRNKDITLELRCVVGDSHGELTRTDAIRANKSRMYGIRRVREFWVSVVIPALEHTEASAKPTNDAELFNLYNLPLKGE